MKVFISYSRQADAAPSAKEPSDEEMAREFFEQADVHRESLDLFFDRDSVAPSEEWLEKISAAIESADVAVVFCSQHYMRSGFAGDEELPRIQRRAESKELELHWFLCRTFAYESLPISRRQAAADPSTPLCRMTVEERAIVFARLVRRLLGKAASRPSRSDADARPGRSFAAGSANTHDVDRIRGILDPLQPTDGADPLDAVAWSWLQPGNSAPRLYQALGELQMSHGEAPASMCREEFVKELLARCAEYKNKARELDVYIDMRRAEAEYALKGRTWESGISELFQIVAQRLPGLYRTAVRSPEWSRAGAAKALQDFVRNVLSHIIVTVRRVLDDHFEPGVECPATANLMLVHDASRTLEPYHHTEGYRVATNMWRGCEILSPRRILVLVHETWKAEEEHLDGDYVGFWIPIIAVGPGRSAIPGAPRACLSGRVERLVPDDLPPLELDPPVPAIETAWRDYMEGRSRPRFYGTLCVSIPIVRRRVQETGGVESFNVGVVNVNVRLRSVWARALSRSWRSLVQRQVAPWIDLLGVAVDWLGRAEKIHGPLLLSPPAREDSA